MNTDNKFTPQTISGSEMIFSIPLYQRLFSWKTREVLKLLSDMKEHFANSEVVDSPYYLGMLTCIKRESGFDLIDGQQRMTVMILLAIAFKDKDLRWGNFLKDGDRLNFVARPEDKEYLLGKIKGTGGESYININMEEGLSTINSYLNTTFNNEEENLLYIDNIYRRLTFFLSYLPESYKNQPSSLNKYFEAMNAQGKGLEQHEILKVQLMRQMKNQEKLTRIWNIVSVMEKPIIPKTEDMDIASYRNMYVRAIDACRSGNYECALNECRQAMEERENQETIDVIKPEKINFTSRIREDSEDSILSYPEFLLLILDICTQPKEVSEFYKPDKLLERFEDLNDKLDIEGFYNKLLHYRLLLDYYVVRREFREGQGVYILAFADSEDTTDCLRQFQSMLYVSTNAFYFWLKPFLMKLFNGELKGSSSMLSYLKQLDNKRHLTVPDKEHLAYGNVDRYWFWRLDYYLWEQRSKMFNDIEQRNVVSPYVFRENRSIEHFHPQNESHNDNWSRTSVDSFGNLAMISQSFNSQQSNDHLQVKFARIEEQINNRSLQSIKMYVMCIKAGFDYKKWTEQLAQEHEEEMVKLLKESYTDIFVDEIAEKR